MGKLSNLLKKKKSKGDDLSGQGSGSTMTGSSMSYETTHTVAPITALVVPPLSLSIPTTDSISSGQTPFSLMDDIMDELAGTTPDTPQPSKTNDLSDFGLAFELSHQLEPEASEAKAGRGPGATSQKIGSHLQTKEAEEVTEAAAKLREASKKANAQLPSDDEGSETSDSDDSDYEPGFKKQQRLLQKQQHQHQLFLQQQLLLQQQLAGEKVGSSVQEEAEVETKPAIVNHEAVIDRMKDRHRALLQGAAAAAREEYYDDYREEYTIVQQAMQTPGAMMAYHMQYGMDPSMMYGPTDDYRLQQQQPQHTLYYPQGGIPAHPHAHANATYNHPSMNGMIPSYGYAHPPAPMPGYSSGMQKSGYQGRGGPMSHIPGILHYQDRSNSIVSDGSVPISLSRRGSVQHSTVSSACVSEDSWNEAHHHPHHQHSISTVSTQKTTNGDSGYSGEDSDQGKHLFDDSLEDIHTAVGFEYEKTKAKLDDVAKVIEVLSIAQANGKGSDGDDEAEEEQEEERRVQSDGNNRTPKTDSSQDEQDEDPDSLKGSTMIDSIRHDFKGISNRSSSSHHSNNDSNENDPANDNESSDDDQPIILNRSNSARGPFPFLPVSSEGAAMMAQVKMSPTQQQSIPTSNGQMYMPHTMNMYQPIQGQMHMSYMPQQQQQQPPQQIVSPQRIMSPQQQLQQQPPQPQQQQTYIPMNYQFPPTVPTNMGHHHSYSVDRAPPPTMMGSGPISRRVGPAASKGHTSTGSAGSATQSLYPMPATTLLHPLPRRSQSVRTRPQATSPIANSNVVVSQANTVSGAAAAAAARNGRSSLDFVRLPSSGYQSVIGGPLVAEFSNSGGAYIRGYPESLSPPPPPQQSQQLQQHLQQQQQFAQQIQQQHQQIQQQMEKKQQGIYMGPMPSQYGYMVDPYSAHLHQQILQAGRR
ncbi:hypothetical protein BGX33_004660 [Mortierella sp. NVP41]|nr:hypothetical protein BGX33_004660 [Mortierella sp. NVP41]